MFDKNEDKNVRIPIAGEVNENSKAIRPSLSRNMKLDSTFYEAEAPDMQHMKINNLDGDVQWWLDRGATPVERKSANRDVFKGINDKQVSEYVQWPGGESDGVPYNVVLLRISPELYHKYKTGPEQERQADIHAAMYRNDGKDPTGATDSQTYAAIGPTGEAGFNEIKRGG